jgi:hypothetical protein
MSSFITNIYLDKRNSKLSLAVFIMLTCLFISASLSELKKINKKDQKLTGRLANINSISNSKVYKTTEDNYSKQADNITHELKANFSVYKGKNDTVDSQTHDSKGKSHKNLHKFVGSHFKNNKNKTLEKSRKDVTENKEPEKVAETENINSIFLETSTNVEKKIESKLKTTQNTNQAQVSNNTSTSNTANPTSNPGNSNENLTANPQQTETNRPNALKLTDPKDPFAYANTKVKCTQVNCPYPSTCVADYVCKCGPEVANYFVDSEMKDNPTYYCIYSRKKQLVAFLLEFFIPPFGHFYAGQYLIATLKLVMPCILLLLFFIQNAVAKSISGAGMCGLSIWWLVDIILYGINKYADQYSVPLASW